MNGRPRKPHIKLRTHGARPERPTTYPRLAAPRTLSGPVTAPGYHRGRTPANRGRKYPPTPPTPAEVLALLDALAPERPLDRRPGGTTAGRRNRALLVVLWRSGLRISEALDLVPGDIDLAHHTITVRSGKGGKRRVVGIDGRATVELQGWLEERAALKGIEPHHPVFCLTQYDRIGKRMRATYVREALNEAKRKAGIRKRVAPHQFRHALAVEMMREGIPLAIIARQLGHSNVATTNTYLLGMAPEEVVNAMAVRSWGNIEPAAPDPEPMLTADEAVARALEGFLDGTLPLPPEMAEAVKTLMLESLMAEPGVPA